MAEKKVNEVALNMVNSLRETNQAVAESIVAAQERNMKFAQSIFMNGMEILKSHAESTQTLVQELGQQMQRQQVALQGLAQDLGQDFGQELEQQMQKQQDTFQKLAQELGQQTQKQQDTFQKLAQESMDLYTNFLRTPFSYYQQAFDAAQNVTRQRLQNVQKASQQIKGATQRVSG